MEDLKSTYNKIAEDWAKDHAVDTWWILGTNKFCSIIKLKSSILDVGCGGGFKTKYLTDKGFKVVGTDFSEKMIECAKKKYPSLDFDVLDLYDLDKYKKNFDAIFAQAVLLHVPKKRMIEVLEKMKNKLNDGGFLYLAVKEKRDGKPDEEIKKENDYGYEYERFFSYFSLSELEDYLKKLNMELIWKDIANSGRTNWIQIVAKKS